MGVDPGYEKSPGVGWGWTGVVNELGLGLGMPRLRRDGGWACRLRLSEDYGSG